MRHRLFTLASVLSLLLGLATAVFWVRSYSRCETVTRAGMAGGRQRLVTGLSWHGSTYLWLNIGARSPAPPDSVKWKVDSMPVNGPTFIPDLNEPAFQRLGSTTVRRSGQWQFKAAGVWVAGGRKLLADQKTGSTWSGRSWGGIFPYWLTTLLLSASPALWLARWKTQRRSHRLRNGLCTSCGYNLTGNASGVCPECGTPIHTPSKALTPRAFRL